MSEHSAISWTHHTRNFWSGCTKVSPACAHCYAETMAKRNSKTFGQWGRGAPRSWHGDQACEDLIRWNRKARESGQETRVFLNSMSDWLDDEVPMEWFEKMIHAIYLTPHLTYLLLTKRPYNFFKRMKNLHTEIFWRSPMDPMEHHQRLLDFIDGWINHGKPPANVWIGVTAEDRNQFARRIGYLRKIPARIRFLSCEPLLEDLGQIGEWDEPQDGGRYHIEGIHWIICGGESGAHHRPFDPDWARSLRDQCRSAGIAFHMKQMSGLRPSSMPPIPEDLKIREFPTVAGASGS